MSWGFSDPCVCRSGVGVYAGGWAAGVSDNKAIGEVENKGGAGVALTVAAWATTCIFLFSPRPPIL